MATDSREEPNEPALESQEDSPSLQEPRLTGSKSSEADNSPSIKPGLRHELVEVCSTHSSLPESQKPCSSSTRKISLPENILRRIGRTESLDVFPHLKRVKSTPRGFAPLCLIENPELRHLHNCSSHSNLPHLKEWSRRSSCPSPCTDLHDLKPVCSSNVQRRRQSFPVAKADAKADKSKSYNKLTSSNSATVISDFAKRKSEQKLAESAKAVTRSQDGRSCDLTTSLQMADSWSSSVLDTEHLRGPVELLKREESHCSSRSSLKSICEEDMTVF
eukprot:gene6295-11717_t